MKNYYGKCASCSHYLINDLRGGDRDGYGCDANGKVFGSSYYKRFPFDHSCGRYKEDRNRSDRDIEKAFKALDYKYGYRPGSSSWWYIATFVNETLGSNMCENYFYTIVDFRENYLTQNLKYVNFLVQYDMYGRLIADSLAKDPQKQEIARELFINPSIEFAHIIKADLTAKNLLSSQGFEGSEEFYVSANPEKFQKSASLFYEIKELPKLALN